MPDLFSYVTLRLPSVRLAVFGREPDGCPDDVVGHRLEVVVVTDPEVIATSGTDQHPVLVPSPDRASKAARRRRRLRGRRLRLGPGADGLGQHDLGLRPGVTDPAVQGTGHVPGAVGAHDPRHAVEVGGGEVGPVADVLRIVA